MIVNRQIVEVEKVIKVQEEKVQIELNIEEAKIIRELLGRIGGGKVRKITDELMNRLEPITGYPNYYTYFDKLGYLTTK